MRQKELHGPTAKGKSGTEKSAHPMQSSCVSVWEIISLCTNMGIFASYPVKEQTTMIMKQTVKYDGPCRRFLGPSNT